MSRGFRSIRRAPWATFLVVALMAAACGGDDSSGPDDAAETTTSVDDDIPAVASSEAPHTDPPDDTVEDGIDETSMPSVPHDEGIDDPPVAVADLSAEQVTGGTDGDARARFEAVMETEGELCVALETELSEITGVHIHIGAQGETGEALLDLTNVLVPSSDFEWLAGCMPIAEAAESALVNSTDALYVDVHTPQSPDGALRGQLHAATLFDLELR